MSLNYSLEYSVTSNDSKIKKIFDIKLMNVIPSIICAERMNHAGISENHSNIMGNFILRFILDDKNQDGTLNDLIKMACDDSYRASGEFKLNCFKIIEDNIIAEHFQAIFPSHDLRFSVQDSKPKQRHIFMLTLRKSYSKIVHTTFIESTGTKRRMARYAEEEIMVDHRGLGAIWFLVF